MSAGHAHMAVSLSARHGHGEGHARRAGERTERTAPFSAWL